MRWFSGNWCPQDRNMAPCAPQKAGQAQLPKVMRKNCTLSLSWPGIREKEGSESCKNLQKFWQSSASLPERNFAQITTFCNLRISTKPFAKTAILESRDTFCRKIRFFEGKKQEKCRVLSQKHRTSRAQTSVLSMQNIGTFTHRSPMFLLFRTKKGKKTRKRGHKTLLLWFCDISDRGWSRWLPTAFSGH